MKNKLFYAFAFLLTIVVFTSCTTSRGYSSHKKGYGCPNSAGIKMESKAQGINA